MFSTAENEVDRQGHGRVPRTLVLTASISGSKPGIRQEFAACLTQLLFLASDSSGLRHDLISGR